MAKLNWLDDQLRISVRVFNMRTKIGASDRDFVHIGRYHEVLRMVADLADRTLKARKPGQKRKRGTRK